MLRGETKRIYVGGVPLGGGAPVSVQSMTNTKTEDVVATAAQIRSLEESGCDIVRVAVPGLEAARAIRELKKMARIPIVADIHFDYKLALESIESGADKIRINPGNIGGDERVKAVALAAKARGIPIRVGVNGGSVPRDLLERFGAPVPQALVETALREIRQLERYDFTDICVAVKSSNAADTYEAYRLLSERCAYPLHIGVTEAGTSYSGIIRSAVGIGGILLAGIGDTIRVSLTADPIEEIRAGIEVLKAAGLREQGLRIISCPSCGRCGIDLIKTAMRVEDALSGANRSITVAVMGCEVNGPGEARQADYGLAGGKSGGVLFKKGEIIGRAPAEGLAEALIEIIESESGVQ